MGHYNLYYKCPTHCNLNKINFFFSYSIFHSSRVSRKMSIYNYYLINPLLEACSKVWKIVVETQSKTDKEQFMFSMESIEPSVNFFTATYVQVTMCRGLSTWELERVKKLIPSSLSFSFLSWWIIIISGFHL